MVIPAPAVLLCGVRNRVGRSGVVNSAQWRARPAPIEAHGPRNDNAVRLCVACQGALQLVFSVHHGLSYGRNLLGKLICCCHYTMSTVFVSVSLHAPLLPAMVACRPPVRCLPPRLTRHAAHAKRVFR